MSLLAILLVSRSLEQGHSHSCSVSARCFKLSVVIIENLLMLVGYVFVAMESFKHSEASITDASWARVCHPTITT